MISYDLVVDPEQMLSISYDDDGAERTTTAVTCRFVPAVGPSGQKQIALEILWDPGVQHPSQIYYCPEARMHRMLLPPGRVRRIRPYRP